MPCNEVFEANIMALELICTVLTMSEGKAKSVGSSTPPANSTVIDPKHHPSRLLGMRKSGYGIGGGYERPLKQTERIKDENPEGLYAAVPIAGYYGGGTTDIRFKVGQAGFRNELKWYGPQFGEQTGFPDKQK